MGHSAQRWRGLCRLRDGWHVCTRDSPDRTGSATRVWERGARPPTEAHVSTGAPHPAEALGVPKFLLLAQPRPLVAGALQPRAQKSESRGRRPQLYRSLAGGVGLGTPCRTQGSSRVNPNGGHASEIKLKNQNRTVFAGRTSLQVRWTRGHKPNTPNRIFRVGFQHLVEDRYIWVLSPALYWLLILK